MSLKKTPFFELRSGTVDLLHFVVKTPDLGALRTELGRRFESTPAFFAGESVAVDVRRLDGFTALQLSQIDGLLAEFRMRSAGVVINDDQRAWAEGQDAPILESRDKRERIDDVADVDDGTESAPRAEPVAITDTRDIAPVAAAAAAVRANTTMVIDRPLRSGQRIYAEGDLVVLGLVSYGAELIAEGNIHVYAPLRGRALAGVHGNHEARIFCTCLEPELISIAGIYRTTEQALAPDLLGKSVQIRLKEEKLLFEPLRLT